MAQDRIDFDLRLTVRSPFLFRGLDGRFVGVDVAHLRDEEGFPIIPADQVRGVFRDAFRLLEMAGAVPRGTRSAMFGDASAGADAIGEATGLNEPNRGKIQFGDLRAAEEIADPDAAKPVAHPFDPTQSYETTRIEIEDTLGSVKTGAMQVVELVARFGAAVTFTGKISIIAEPGQADTWRRRLTQALASITSIGAMKSPGFGEVLQAFSAIGAPAVRSLALPSSARELSERIRLRVRFDRPILVDAAKVSGNAVEGRSIIPGAVFKGALARRLEMAGAEPETGAVGKVLSTLIFSHAFPEIEETGRVGDQSLPLSLVQVKGEGGKDTFGDACRIPQDHGAMIAGKAGRFLSDWKDESFEAARTRLDRPSAGVPLLARTHTAIDNRTGTAAGSKLFTTLARSIRRPIVIDQDAKPTVAWGDRTWLFDVDLGLVPSEGRPEACRLIEALLADGLDDIGRTGAHASFTQITPQQITAPEPVFGTADRYAIVLETPAMVLDAAAECGTGVWQRSPFEAYQAYWHMVLGPDAEVLNVFAAQSYQGGYIARRRRLYGAYHPFLLTAAGAVFLVRTRNVDRLTELGRYGLPPPQMARGAPPTWRNCPYLRENGYGQVTIGYLGNAEAAELLDVVSPDAPATGDAS